MTDEKDKEIDKLKAALEWHHQFVKNGEKCSCCEAVLDDETREMKWEVHI